MMEPPAPLAPVWFAWGLIVLSVLFIPAIGYVFLGLAFGGSIFDTYMRFLALFVYLSFFITATSAFRQLRQSLNHGFWPQFWITLVSGLIPLALFFVTIVLYSLVDAGIADFDLYAFDIGFVLNLVSILGVMASVVVMFICPYQPRLFISFAMPLHAIAASLLMWVVFEFYSPI